MKKRPAKTFQELVVWQKAPQFVMSLYQLSASFPKSELYGLTSQARRAAVSIPANIAEGFKKRTTHLTKLVSSTFLKVPLKKVVII